MYSPATHAVMRIIKLKRLSNVFLVFSFMIRSLKKYQQYRFYSMSHNARAFSQIFLLPVDILPMKPSGKTDWKKTVIFPVNC